MLRYGKFPYGIGTKFMFQVHEPIEANGDVDELIRAVEEKITQSILQND